MKPLRLILLSIAILLLGACSTSRSIVAIDYPKVDSGYNYQGILEEQIYKCSVEGPKERRMFVYLPQDYYSNTDSYPVFYLLHTFSLKMESHNFPYPFLVCVCVSHIKKQFLHTIWCTTIRLILSGFCQR